LGSAQAISAKEARRKARSVLANVVLGSDPQDEREILRPIPTLKEFVRDSYLPFAEGAKRSWRTDETILRLHILPSLGHLALDQITSQAVAAIVRKLKKRGYASGTTNRVVILLRYILNRAKEWGTPGSEKNSTTGLKTEPDVSRERYLSAEETVRLLQALDADENRSAARAIKLLLLTGARRNEIAHAKWERTLTGKTKLSWCHSQNRTSLVSFT
jgi:integrase